MTTHRIGRIVSGCLTGGPIVALAVVLGPLGGAEEHVITGAALLVCALSWALLAALSTLWTTQPQRWASLPAGFLGLAGAGLLVFAPSGSVIDALGWVWPPLLLALVAATVVRVRRALVSRTRSWVVYPLLGVYALCAVGGGYQTLRESLDRRMYPAPGQLVDVGGHRLHLTCTGSGTPTVILESGLGATAAYWAWISTAVAPDTQVCVYDRAGRGWSDPASAPQDGVAVATDLRLLLNRARVAGPYVLVGHSSGAQYVRIFAGRYPELVAGMVLLDGQPAEALERLPNFPAFYGRFRRISALLPSLARLGVARLVSYTGFSELPADARAMQRLSYSSARLYRSLRDEFVELPTSLAQARSFQNFGDRPLVIVTAERDAQVGWLPLQEEMATLSANSSHRVVPYTHDELVTDQAAAQTSIQAIRDVVQSVRFGTSLKNPSTQGADGDSLNAYIRAGMRTAHVPGLALGVVRGGQVAYLKGYGSAGPGDRPVTPQTPFILGSTSKSFTALAVMQLVEAGKIDLDAPVTRYLPWFRTRDIAGSARISVRHLLHHTSGLRTYEGRQGLWDDDQSGSALETGVRELSSAQLKHPAGQQFEYANGNYNTLGLIVQSVSGSTYEEYVRSAIFGPLQMSHSAAALSDPAAADLAWGYRHWLLWPVRFDAPYPRRMTPAGFLISSAEDLTHYLAAQLNGGRYGHRQLLSPRGVATLHTPAATIAPSTSYGMGWAIRSVPGSTKIWHDGDVSNFHSHLRLMPDQHLGIVVLMNVGGSGQSSAINGLVDGIAATLLGNGQAAATGSAEAALSRFMVIIPLLIAILWAAWSCRSLRRWQRGRLPTHGRSRLWRLYVPLAIEVCVVGLIWTVPAAVHTPLPTIALFTPGVFAVVAAIAVLIAGCMVARTFVVLRTGFA